MILSDTFTVADICTVRAIIDEIVTEYVQLLLFVILLIVAHAIPKSTSERPSEIVFHRASLSCRVSVAWFHTCADVGHDRIHDAGCHATNMTFDTFPTWLLFIMYLIVAVHGVDETIVVVNCPFHNDMIGDNVPHVDDAVMFELEIGLLFPSRILKSTVHVIPTISWVFWA